MKRTRVESLLNVNLNSISLSDSAMTAIKKCRIPINVDLYTDFDQARNPIVECELQGKIGSIYFYTIYKNDEAYTVDLCGSGLLEQFGFIPEGIFISKHSAK
jgi:hypothetical protein